MRNLVVIYEGLHTYGGMAGRDMEALAIGIAESVADDHVRTRVDQVRYLGQHADRVGACRLCSRLAATPSSWTQNAFYPHIPQEQFPAQTLAAELYLDSGVRSMERGVLSAGPRPRHRRPSLSGNLELDAPDDSAPRVYPGPHGCGGRISEGGV
jgi:tyrosine phenol-lyase